MNEHEDGMQELFEKMNAAVEESGVDGNVAMLTADQHDMALACVQAVYMSKCGEMAEMEELIMILKSGRHDDEDE